MPRTFIKRVQNFIFSQQLFSQKDKIIIGISGGPDSVCLVRVLDKLKRKYQLELSLVHINYGLRGRDSLADEKFVQKLAQELKLPLKVYYYQEKTAGNLEENLRNFRYQLFEKERKAQKFDWIAVAHQLDDQAETFLMNLLRGSGLKGLGAMKPKTGKIIRPLLGLERKEILVCLQWLGQKYRLDKTNLDTKWLRNRIRLKLIPLLEKEYNPAVKKKLADLAENLRLDFELVEEIGNSAYNRVVNQSTAGAALEVLKFNKLPLATRKYIFRRIVINLKGNAKDLSLANFKEFEKIIQSQKSKRQQMKLGRVVIEKRGNKIFFNEMKRTKI